MRKQCVPGSLSPPPREPGHEATRFGTNVITPSAHAPRVKGPGRANGNSEARANDVFENYARACAMRVGVDFRSGA